MAKEKRILVGRIVTALDEDGTQASGSPQTSCVSPDGHVAWGAAYNVRLDVAPHEQCFVRERVGQKICRRDVGTGMREVGVNGVSRWRGRIRGACHTTAHGGNRRPPPALDLARSTMGDCKCQY